MLCLYRCFGVQLVLCPYLLAWQPHHPDLTQALGDQESHIAADKFRQGRRHHILGLGDSLTRGTLDGTNNITPKRLIYSLLPMPSPKLNPLCLTSRFSTPTKNASTPGVFPPTSPSTAPPSSPSTAWPTSKRPTHRKKQRPHVQPMVPRLPQRQIRQSTVPD